MILEFFRTTSTGQQKIGQISYEDHVLQVDDPCRAFAFTLFGEDPSDRQIVDAMKTGSVRFDGAYVRAALVGKIEEKELGGRWVTISGARVFIKDGQSPEDALALVKDVEVKYGSGLDSKEAEARSGLSESNYREMFHLPGHTTEVRHRITSVGKFQTRVDWKDAEGNDVGFATRYFDGKVAKNEVFQLDEKNKGLGRTLYKQQIDVLTRAGYEEIQLFADITIGRYAWAKMGFDYVNDPVFMAKNASHQFKAWASKRGIEEPKSGWPTFKSARDAATYKMSGVTMVGKDITNRDVPLSMKMDVGKAFMLDKEPSGHGAWGGVLKLGS